MKNKNNKEMYLSSRGRRKFLRTGAGSMAGAWLSALPWQDLIAQQDLNPIEENWDAGIVRHLLPAVNHSTFLIKASFNRPLESAPTLQIREGSNRLEAVGILNDTAGEFWQFYTTDLRPDTQYELTLRDGVGNSLCET